MSSVNLNESKQGNLRALLIAMMVLPTVVILVRFWSRALLPAYSMSKMPTRFWWDDWTALAAAMLNIAVCGIGLQLINLGMGLHFEMVNPNNLEPFLKLLWIEYFIFDTGTAVAKSSALFFYARVFGVVNSTFRYGLWVVHFLNIGWLIGILFGVIFECSPIEKAWKVTLPGTCLNTGNLWLGSGIGSLLIDVIILLMPLPMLWQLQLKMVRKLQIIGVFICGYLVVVVSIGRLITIVQAGTSLQTDPTYKIATPVLWLGSEIAISVTSVSLPSLLFLFQRAYRDGAWSLISTRARGSTSKLVSNRSLNSHTHSRDGDETELTPSFDYNNEFAGNSKPNSHIIASRAPLQAISGENSYGSTPSRIHVRNDVVVS